jgi:hypothetical protein
MHFRSSARFPNQISRGKHSSKPNHHCFMQPDSQGWVPTYRSFMEPDSQGWQGWQSCLHLWLKQMLSFPMMNQMYAQFAKTQLLQDLRLCLHPATTPSIFAACVRGWRSITHAPLAARPWWKQSSSMTKIRQFIIIILRSFMLNLFSLLLLSC